MLSTTPFVQIGSSSHLSSIVVKGPTFRVGDVNVKSSKAEEKSGVS